MCAAKVLWTCACMWVSLTVYLMRPNTAPHKHFTSPAENSRSHGSDHGAQQWSFPTIVEDELVPALPLSTHSAVEMLHDSGPWLFTLPALWGLLPTGVVRGSFATESFRSYCWVLTNGLIKFDNKHLDRELCAQRLRLLVQYATCRLFSSSAVRTGNLLSSDVNKARSAKATTLKAMDQGQSPRAVLSWEL